MNQTLARTVARDVELGGHTLRKGDPLLVSWLAANHDPAQFDRPDDVVLDRADNRHLAFGLGPHRCIGSHLARAMFQVMLREVLTRISDYRVDFDGVLQYLGKPGHDRAPDTARHLHTRAGRRRRAAVLTNPAPGAAGPRRYIRENFGARFSSRAREPLGGRRSLEDLLVRQRCVDHLVRHPQQVPVDDGPLNSEEEATSRGASRGRVVLSVS